MSNNFVALTHRACPACTKPTEEEILLHKKMQDISHMHKQCVGIASKLCADCQKQANENDGVWVVGIDERQTTDRNNPFRTARVLLVKRTALERMFKDFSAPKRCVYAQQDLIEILDPPKKKP